MNSNISGKNGLDISRVVLKLEDADFSRIEGDYWTRFLFESCNGLIAPKCFRPRTF